MLCSSATHGCGGVQRRCRAVASCLYPAQRTAEHIKHRNAWPNQHAVHIRRQLDMIHGTLNSPDSSTKRTFAGSCHAAASRARPAAISAGCAYAPRVSTGCASSLPEKKLVAGNLWPGCVCSCRPHITTHEGQGIVQLPLAATVCSFVFAFVFVRRHKSTCCPLMP